MGTVASQITSLTIVYSTVYSDAQMASNAENVSIWWRHHVDSLKLVPKGLIDNMIAVD